MDVLSACALRVGSIVWRSGQASWALTIAAKATFVLLPGESPLADEHDPLHEGDGHWNDDEQRSLHWASDLAPFKAKAEVLLVGSAYAPRGALVSSLVARLIVAGVDKSVAVFADRAWTQEGLLREGPRFNKMSLRWERAGGGPGTRNPAGVRADAPPDRYGLRALPNVVSIVHYPSSPGEFIDPVGYGPIAPSWPERAEALHRHVSSFRHVGWSREPLPRDIDPRYFNAAPLDQQVDEIRSGERLVLEHLHPEHARLVTNLAPLAPRATVERRGARPEAVNLRCDTLTIDTDRGTCSLVWRGQIAIAGPDEALRVVVTEGEGAGKGDISQTLTGPMVAPPARSALPFLSADKEVDTDITTAMTMDPRAPTLPFVPGQSALAGVVSGPFVREDAGGTGTLYGSMGASRGGELPFGSKPGTFEPKPGVVEPKPIAFEPKAPEPLRVVGAPLAFGAPLAWAPAPAPLRAAPPPLESAPTPLPLPEEPPLIGPLATPEMAARVEAAKEAPKALEEAPLPKEPPRAVPAPEPLPIEKFTLERCAAIAASIARSKAEKKAILERHAISERDFERVQAHWLGAIKKESQQGKMGLLSAYDTAYLAQLEEERGPIGVDEYARLVVAAERGIVEETAAALGIPRGAVIRIERVWTGRTARSPGLGGEVRAALEGLRGAW